MPIPLIIGAGALAASGFGITKGAKGVSQLSDASATIERAQRRLEPPRLYRRVDCLSQAALSDSQRLS
ncbi:MULTISPECIES: hypothetical protein [unclassified Psychrobacter]|uniref:hypothetical protein n=1 Tax=unclassified Psychrobacter TaxID=196806 RepID=UPI001788239B|nr:hypothetical protein [Psychrobacter sp. FME13]MBE0443511.1 hypothetical protein [Psychrobacter sp. FME13]